MRRFLVGVLAVLSVSARANGRPGLADHCVSREAVRTGPNLVSTTNGRLLVWSPDGQGQIRDNTGHWSPVLQLGAPEIRAAVADPEGFLLLRHGPGVEVLLLDSAGTKRASWTADVRDDVSLASRPGGRWLLTNRVLIPLLPRSTLGPCEPLPQSIVSRVNPDVPFPPVPPPDLLDDRNGARLVCLPRSPYADGYGDGLCERTGPGGWRVPHHLEGPVVLCGDWILQAGENTVVLRFGANRAGTGHEARRCRRASELRWDGPGGGWREEGDHPLAPLAGGGLSTKGRTRSGRLAGFHGWRRRLYDRWRVRRRPGLAWLCQLARRSTAWQGFTVRWAPDLFGSPNPPAIAPGP